MSEEFYTATDRQCCAARLAVTARYLDLLEASLTGMLTRDPPQDPWSGIVVAEGDPAEKKFGISPGVYRSELRATGRDWPATAPTMIGQKRMRQLREAVQTVLQENIPGDFIETGIWRGGACIYMRGILAAYGNENRIVYGADSFEGLPKPELPQDAGDQHHIVQPLAVSLEDVKANFARYGLLDDQVRFIKGWFKDTLRGAPRPIRGELAILRLDGDMYTSTWDALRGLYRYVSRGGFIIVDDYGAVKRCADAVNDFRRNWAITTPMISIDGIGVYWRKE